MKKSLADSTHQSSNAVLSNVTKESRREVVVLESLTQENSVTMLLLEKVIELSKPEANALCVEEITEEEA